jgi:hypothetical protein
MEWVNKRNIVGRTSCGMAKINGRLHWEGRCGQTENNAPGNAQKHRKEERMFIMPSAERVVNLSIIELTARGG